MSPRPNFEAPFPAGTRISIQTYRGHNPDDKKMDIYAEGWPHDSAVVAAADGLVHEHFDPGGIEINHGGGWFTTYMHMSQRAPVGTRVRQGEWVGKAGSVGTGAKHLHHEQLKASAHATDADTRDMVNPVIQGIGPMHLVPGKPVHMVSTNAAPGRQRPSPSKHTDTEELPDMTEAQLKALMREAIREERPGLVTAMWARKLTKTRTAAQLLRYTHLHSVSTTSAVMRILRSIGRRAK